jgi:hypothetical protein
MSATEIIEQLQHLSNADRLAVIEAASRLVRVDLLAESSGARPQQDRRLQEAARALKDLYEPGGELTEWTDLDAEDFLDGSVPG